MAKLTKLLSFITLFCISLSSSAITTTHGPTNVLGANSPDFFFEGYTFLSTGTVIDDIFMFNIADNTPDSILSTTGAIHSDSSGTFGIRDFEFALTDHMGDAISAWGMSGDTLSFSPVGSSSMMTYGVHYKGIVSGAFAGVIMETTSISPAPVPVPAATWLFGSAMFGLLGISRSRKEKAQ